MSPYITALIVSLNYAMVQPAIVATTYRVERPPDTLTLDTPRHHPDGPAAQRTKGPAWWPWFRRPRTGPAVP